MLLAHLSDFHIFSNAPETSLVRGDIVEACRRIVADIAGLTPAVDIVLLTGDLADGGSSADYALLKDVLAPLEVPVLVVPGNHDKRQTLREAFGHALPFGEGPYLNYEAWHGGVRILALDTLVEGKVYGALSPDQLDWLAARLATPIDQLTLICLHHPPFPSGIASLDRMALIEGAERFGEIIGAYRGPLRIHAGHIHRPFHTLWRGVFCAVGGSPAFQHELDLAASEAEPGAIAEPYAYFLHQIESPASIRVHTRYVALPEQTGKADAR